jgi:hypothetical protein
LESKEIRASDAPFHQCRFRGFYCVQRTVQGSAVHVQRLNEVLLSLNLALAFLYALVVQSFVAAAYSKQTSNAYSFLYCFFRAAVRINNLLHYHPAFNEKYIRWPDAGGRLGVELAFALSAVCIGICFLTIVRATRGSRFYNEVQRPVAALVYFLVFPAIYVLVFDRSELSAVRSTWSAALPELLCAGFLIIVFLLRPFSLWAMGVLMLLHDCFWAAVYFKNRSGQTIYGNIPPPILLLLIPLGGAVWLFYRRISTHTPSVKLLETSRKGWLLTGFAVSAVALSAMWLPGRGYSLEHARNRAALTIEMWHSNCQIGCPVYKVTVHGNGTVEYIGEQFVGIRGAQTAVLNDDQIRRILEGFDRADFFNLEDQAFAWGYHTPRVDVRITVDGKNKEVSSDMYNIGAKSGAQAKFVAAAAATDEIVETDRWVKCGDDRCRQ